MKNVRTAGKKDELLQLRIDRPLLEQISKLAEEKHIPLSVMIRTWLSDRVRDEIKLMNENHLAWEKRRFEDIYRFIGSGFELGPVLVIHGYPSAKLSIDIREIERNAPSLIPWSRSAIRNERINQFGYEVVSTHKGLATARGQLFKSGHVEGVFSVPVEEKEIFGMTLDYFIATTIQTYSHILRNEKIELPYLFKVFLLRAKSYSLTVFKTIASSHPPEVFSENWIELPGITITDFSQVESESKTAEYLLPVLDELWNAAGMHGSASFYDSGKWVERK
jgi:hypothetical protein